MLFYPAFMPNNEQATQIFWLLFSLHPNLDKTQNITFLSLALWNLWIKGTEIGYLSLHGFRVRVSPPKEIGIIFSSGAKCLFCGFPFWTGKRVWGLNHFFFFNRNFDLLFFSPERHIILWLLFLYFIKTTLECFKGLKFLWISEAEIVVESSQMKS